MRVMGPATVHKNPGMVSNMPGSFHHIYWGTTAAFFTSVAYFTISIEVRQRKFRCRDLDGIALFGHGFPYLWRCKRRDKGGIDALDLLRAQALGADHGDPAFDQVAGVALLCCGGNVWRGGDPRGCRHANRMHRAGLDVGLRRRQRQHAHIDLAGNDVGHHGGDAAVGNVGDEGAGHILEHLGRQMQDGAVAAGGQADFNR